MPARRQHTRAEDVSIRQHPAACVSFECGELGRAWVDRKERTRESERDKERERERDGRDSIRVSLAFPSLD
jgi:hypothetical protein